MSASLPVLALTSLGVLIAVLGLFAVGDIRVTIVGLVALVVASILGIWERRSDPSNQMNQIVARTSCDERELRMIPSSSSSPEQEVGASHSQLPLKP